MNKINTINKIILAFAIMFLVSPVVIAESGTITITDSKESEIPIPYFSTAGAANFSYFYMDYVNYNSVSVIIVNSTYISFPQYYRSTTFNCKSPNMCSGYVFWDANNSRIQYQFISSQIVQQQVILNLTNSSFFSGVSFTRWYNGFVPSVYASFAASGSPILFTGETGTALSLNIYSIVNLDTTDSYAISYPINKYFQVDINKSGIISSKYIIHSANTVYSTEPTFNNKNITGAIFEQLNGIYLNATLESGIYTTVLVNSSGCDGCSVVIPESRTTPTTGANIYTDKASYVLGENIAVEWFIADNPYNNLLSDCEFIVNDEIIAQSINQHDNYTIINPIIGTKKLEIGCGVISSTIVATKSVQVVAEGQSYLLFNATQFSRVPFNITYHIGYSLTGYSPSWMDIGIFSSTGQKIDTLTGISTRDGQLQAQASRVYPEGTYTVKLYDAKRNAVIFSSPLTIIRADTIPTIGILVSNITTDRGFYYINDYMNINYRVDDANYTNYSIMVQIYNNNISQITKQYTVSTTDQVGSFDTLVNTKDNLLCEGARYCWFESGINSVRLVAYNSTFSKILDAKNITVSTTTVDGWGLILSSNNITTTEKLTIRTIIPVGFTGTLRIRDAGYGNTTSIYSQSVSEGSNTYITTVNRVNRDGVGYYDVELKDNFGVVKIHIPLTVRKIVIDTTTTTTTTPQTMNNLVSFLSLPAFWGILIFVFGVIGTAWKAPGATGIVALILSNLEAIVGLWAPYTIYVFLVTWIIAAIYFTLGRQTATGGQ